MLTVRRSFYFNFDVVTCFGLIENTSKKTLLRDRVGNVCLTLGLLHRLSGEQLGYQRETQGAWVRAGWL